MDAVNYAGRVGGLAAAVGVGALLYLMPTTASADPGTSDTTRTANSRGTDRPTAGPERTGAKSRNTSSPTAGVRGVRAARPQRHSDPVPLTSAATPSATLTARPPAANGTMYAAARRELTSKPASAWADAGATPTAHTTGSGLFANPITVAPVTAKLTDGIIGGAISAVDAYGHPLIYTVTRTPNLSGKVNLDGDAGTFTYLPDYSVLTSGATEKFGVLLSEETPFVAALDKLANDVDFAARDSLRAFLATLHQIPIVNVLLWPIIGRSHAVTVSIDNAKLVPSPFTTPVANTVKVISFDGTPISTNFFPAVGLHAGQTAPTIFTTAGFSSPGMTDPYGEWDRSVGERPGLSGYVTPGIAPLRGAGYNVVTWDSRGKFDSGGQLEFGSPHYEGRDAQTLITYYTNQGWVTTDPTGDPLIGMVGGSFGGVQALVTASIDRRLDAIVPAIAPHALVTGIYPHNAFNTLWGGFLLPSAVLGAGDRVDPQLYLGVVTGTLFGWISPKLRHMLDIPGAQVADITAATLLIAGVPDTLLPLNESLTNTELLLPVGTPTKSIWYCGGHGVCLDKPSPIQNSLILDSTLNWLNKYVKGQSAPEIPTFQWVDQLGQFYASERLPEDPKFTGDPLVASGPGGILPIISVLGGGGPSLRALPSPALASSRALNAVNLKITAPQTPASTKIVGVPELTFGYRGIGLNRHVFAQFVDDETGLVLGNNVTPIPVVLDGRKHTVTVALNGIAQTMAPGTSITLQLTNSALPFINHLSLGAINFSALSVSLPTVAEGAAVPL